MTEKEIRLELAKAALIGGAPIAKVEEMLVWVKGTEEAKTDLDTIKVSEMEQFLGMSAIRFRNRCMANDIHTVGQLVRIGGRNFRTLHLVGSRMVDKIRNVLREQYGVEEW